MIGIIQIEHFDTNCYIAQRDFDSDLLGLKGILGWGKREGDIVRYASHLYVALSMPL